MKICISKAVLVASLGLSAEAFVKPGVITTREATGAFLTKASSSIAALYVEKKSFSLSELHMVATSPPAEVIAADESNLNNQKSDGSLQTAPPPKKLAQRWRKKTKQVATLGPASSTVEMIETLFLAGTDVFRLNFSHGSQEQKKELLDMIRQVEEKYSHPIAVLGDLQGPKLRVGQFSNPDGVFLKEGQTFRFDLKDDDGDFMRVKMPHPEIIEASEIGHVLLIDDGKMKMTVTGKGPGYIDCVVNVEGKIKDRKGVNTPDSILEISPLTPKDRSDLEYMLKIGVDWVALSFVQRPADIVEIKQLIDQHLPADAFRPAIMAKIEKPSCFFGDNLEKIVELCDGIMVARGDLGVECAPEDVPLLQKEIIDECREQGKPVVVATQMLESMIESPTPTRAEVSDVSTAIYDGADAIMLSAESAAGKYPKESVEMQQRIINRVEGDNHYQQLLQSHNQRNPDKTPTDAIIAAARQIANTINASAIVCFTLRGTTVLRASKGRPGVPILAVTPFKETSRQLALSWGVYPELPKEGSYGQLVGDEFSSSAENKVSQVPDCDASDVEEVADDFDLVLREACRAALHKGLVSNLNELLVVTAGLPFGTPGAANVIRVVPAAGPLCWDGVYRVD
jgi:pyruvate kinase